MSGAATPEGKFERIEAVLDGEDRTAFVREAVERELKRRERPNVRTPTVWQPRRNDIERGKMFLDNERPKQARSLNQAWRETGKL